MLVGVGVGVTSSREKFTEMEFESCTIVVAASLIWKTIIAVPVIGASPVTSKLQLAGETGIGTHVPTDAPPFNTIPGSLSRAANLISNKSPTLLTGSRLHQEPGTVIRGESLYA